MITLSSTQPPRLGISPFPSGETEADYAERLHRLDAAIRREGLDALIVYGDREHSGNVAYVTSVDPRFEEALLVVTREGRRTLLLGNESLAMAPSDSLGIRVVLFQDFSPHGQPRSNSSALLSILRDAGLDEGMRVGSAGWKSQTPSLLGDDVPAAEIPTYIYMAVARAIGASGTLVDANPLFLRAGDGLRTTITVDELPRYEYAASVATAGVRAGVERLRPGMSEIEVESSFAPRGLPLSCHSMVNFGDKARQALSSPSARELREGDPFHMAFGVRGSLSCRAGMAVEDLGGLDSDVAEFYEAYASNYFATVAAWYESLRLGRSGGEVFAAVEEIRDGELFDFALNPGHLLHQEEWSTSIFSAGDENPLRSGMLLQCDIIPVSKGPFVLANAEDGVVLGDEGFREALQTAHPELWSRVQARTRYMRDCLGIDLDEAVLPLSDTCGWFAPFALDASTAFVVG